MTATETTPTMTAKVAAIVERIKSGGYAIEKCEVLGEYSKKIWVTARRLHLCPLYPVDGHPALNEVMFGWIGPRGAFEFTHMNGYCKPEKLTEWYRLRSVTEPKSKPNA